MGRVATDAANASTDIEAFTIQVYIAAFRTVGLDGVPWCAFGLVANEKDVVPFVAQHGFEVIDDASTRAHAVACDDDGGTCCLCQMVDHGDMVGVAVDLDQVVEG